jgi:hypothetical protein
MVMRSNQSQNACSMTSAALLLPRTTLLPKTVHTGSSSRAKLNHSDRDSQ